MAFLTDARVLLVEDQPGDASLFTASLSADGAAVQVEWVDTLAAARDRLEAARYDCVVADLGLPDADGVEVVAGLRSHLRDAPLVVLTGRWDEDFAAEVIQSGADDYLLKDELTPRLARRSIDYAMERAAARARVYRASAQTDVVMASLRDGVVVLDVDMRVESLNAAGERMLGIASAAAAGHRLRDLLDRLNVPLPADETPEAILAAGRSLDLLPGRLTGGGRALELHVEVTCDPLRRRDGAVDGGVVTIRDVSAQVIHEEALRFQGALLTAVGQAVVVLDPQGQVLFWNPAAEQQHGYSAAQAFGCSAFELLVPSGAAATLGEIDAALAAGQVWQGEIPLLRRDGSDFPALATVRRLDDDAGVAVATIVVATDISAQRLADRTAQQMAAIIEATADAVFAASLDGVVLTWNPGAQALYGYSPGEIVGRAANLLEPDHDDEVENALRAVATGRTIRDWETVRRAKDGRDIDVSITVSPILDSTGRPISAAVVTRDITQRRVLERRLTSQALYDALTGLPNRTLLTDRLQQALAASERHHSAVAVLFIDLDRFKVVNDTSGHGVGDELLVSVAERLARATRASDTVARLGGDEFVMVCGDTDREGAFVVAQRIADSLNEPFDLGSRRLRASASIGIAVTPPLEADADTLLSHADVAMYEAKEHGRSRAVLFESWMAADSSDRVELTAELGEALGADQLELHYQPVVDIGTGNLLGVEALARWHHPTRGPIPPDVFVALAEGSGLSFALDTWVLRRASRDIGDLLAREVLPPHAHVAINISGHSIVHPDLVAAVQLAAAGAGLALGSVVIEVTETALISDHRAARPVLDALREQGVLVSLDDFGTGYSSLTYLRDLPLDSIKIDRTFMEHITERPRDEVIVEAVLRLARGLRMPVIAEGIETEAQVEILRRLGCPAGQGYLWSRPLPLAELVAFVAP